MYVVLQMWNDVAIFKESLGMHSGLKSKKVQFSKDSKVPLKNFLQASLSCINKLYC